MSIDYDDFYSLTEYVSRFTSDCDRYIGLWLSQVSVLSRIEIWEMEHGNSLFRKDNMPALLEEIESDEVLSPSYVIDTLSLSSIVVDNGKVLAETSIYYDFVGFLLQIGLVK